MGIPEALDALTLILGQRLSRSKSDLDIHSRSESHFGPALPDAVAYPENTAEVSQIAQVCNAQDCPIIGWGAGTSLEGHALAIHGGVVIDFAKMSGILEVRDADMCVRVQPGITREALNDALRATGLFFPVDPGANASLGGMAATRASGTTAVRYGTMRDNVIGLEVVLADGRIMRTGGAARKSSAGYDLTALMVGSEGTLGLITELTLRLSGQPEAISAAVCAFGTTQGAVNAVIETIQSGIPMARIEYLDAATVAAFNAYAERDMPLQPHLMIEFHGSESGVAEQSEAFGSIIAEHGGSDFKWSTLAEERNALWEMRHNGYYAVLASKPGATALVTDVCVPISELAHAVEAAQAHIGASFLEGPILGHVGDGNFHSVILVNRDNKAEIAEAKRLSHLMVSHALDVGGTATGEHGIGMGKLDYMEREHGIGWDAMAALKGSLDPNGILNPGKMIRQT